MYDEEIRERLNKKIKDEYYFREIGFETPEYFKRRLNHKMNMIMPYYNQLYKSADLDYNPLFNIDITETFEHETESKGNTKQDGETTGKEDSTTNQTNNRTLSNKTEVVNVESDTPKTNVSMAEIKNNAFASRTTYDVNDDTSSDISNTDNTSKGNSSQNMKSNADTTQSNKESYVRKTEGSSAGLPYSKAIEQWRKVMINIDLMVIEELEDLFFGLW